SLLATCVDVMELSRYLPSAWQETLSYESKKAEAEACFKKLAEVIVATRNQVAHAKSNYSPQGTEANPADPPRFNEFLRFAEEQTIRWYNRLPNHQKILG